MTREEIIRLYCKEREYQESVFGNYAHQPALNISSFLGFVEFYLKRAKDAYVGKWKAFLPPWMTSCREASLPGPAPVGTYEDLIKVFALAGAALEAYAEVDVEHWREEGIKEKWKEE